MTDIINMDAVKKLPIAARREIIDSIEESIEMEYNDTLDDDYALETEEEIAILKERLAEHKKNPEKAISWENLKKKLLTRNR